MLQNGNSFEPRRFHSCEYEGADIPDAVQHSRLFREIGKAVAELAHTLRRAEIWQKERQKEDSTQTLREHDTPAN